MSEPHEATGTVADAMAANAYDETLPGSDEGGRIQTMTSLRRRLGYDDQGRPTRLDTRLRQGEWWRQKDGEWIRIADMEPSHRANTARMLLRKAAGYAEAVGYAELGLYAWAPGDVVDSWMQYDAERMGDPQQWIRSTPLYKALVADLEGADARELNPKPVDMRTDDIMAAFFGDAQ